MKAAHWLGLGTDCVRVIKVDERGVMVTEALNKAIEEEIEANNIPLMVNATAGTTVLGAIDDLQSIAATCKKFGVWLHVDVSFATSLSDKHIRRWISSHGYWDQLLLCGMSLINDYGRCYLFFASQIAKI